MDKGHIRLIGIVGAGTMGAQIALHCAAHGYDVRLFSRSTPTLQGAAHGHARELEDRMATGAIAGDEKERILGRIRPTTQMGEAVIGSDLVIETVTEDIKIKRAVFAELDRLSPPQALLASNSSSIPVSAMEDVVSRPERLLNMHFYSPVWQRPMVELMGGAATKEDTLRLAHRFVRTLELTPLQVRKESMGFLFNRVWRAIKKECLHLAGDGVASFEDVDRAWMIAFHTPAGPFGLMDMVGLDVVHDIETAYYRASGDPSDAPPPILLERIARGDLGVKTGKGFYTYPHPAFQEPGWLKGDGP